MTCCPYLSSGIINPVIYGSHLKADRSPGLEQDLFWYLELSLQRFFPKARVFLRESCFPGAEAPLLFVLPPSPRPPLFFPFPIRPLSWDVAPWLAVSRCWCNAADWTNAVLNIPHMSQLPFSYDHVIFSVEIRLEMILASQRCGVKPQRPLDSPLLCHPGALFLVHPVGLLVLTVH